MYTGLNGHLGLKENASFQEQFIALLDSNINGNFLLHHFISTHLKYGGKVCLVGCVQTLSHYANVAQKFGLNFSTLQAEGRLQYIDLMKEIVNAYSEEETLLNLEQEDASLRNLWTELDRCCDEKTLLVIDDLSSLVNIGFHWQTVNDFLHYCQVTSKTKNSSIVVLSQQNDDDVACIRVTSRMKKYATVVVNVGALKTGYSRDLSGELQIESRLTHTKEKLHFKLHDKDVKFFAPGTSSAVL